MKEKILKALRNSGKNYLSSAELCETFGVSRQAIWKNIALLKKNGYAIEACANKGYRLTASPDKLYAPDILSRLSEDCICREIKSFETVDSTNTKAKQLAELGAEEGTLIVAEEQTAGKGRRGRKWKTEKGSGIWMTLLLRPDMHPSKVSGITLLTALAVVQGIYEVCGATAQIKWPNDVVIAKKKICGILTEMSSEENYIHYVVSGIGINVNHTSFPEELQNASSIFLETGKKVDRCELTAHILQIFSSFYTRYVEEQSLSSFVDAYNSVLANKDQEVRVYYGLAEETDEEKAEIGIARGINQEGALLVEMENGIREIISGEVSVRGLYGYI